MNNKFLCFPVTENLKNLLTFFLTLLFLISIGEIIIRILEPPPDTKGIQIENSQRLFGFKCNFKGKAGGVEFKTNSSGFRTREFEEAINSQDTIIMVLGDSYSFGYGVSYQDSFPYILERKLRKEFSRKIIRIFNLGIPGYNTTQELATLKEFGPKLHPQLVLLTYHLNDIEVHTENNIKELFSFKNMLLSIKYYSHLLRFVLSRVAAFARNFNLNIKTTATMEISEYTAAGPAWIKNQKTLKELIEFCHKLNAVLGVIVVPYIVQLTNDHPCADSYQIVVKFFKSNNIPVVNAFEYFKGLNPRKLWINAFDGHPNRKGHEIIACAASKLIINENLLFRNTLSQATK
jgi:lysophospholipase L1-like esterase